MGIHRRVLLPILFCFAPGTAEDGKRQPRAVKKGGRVGRPHSVLFLILICVGPAAADNYRRQPSIDVLNYGISLEISDSSDEIKASTSIRIRILADGVSRLWLDLEGMKVGGVQAGGNSLSFKQHASRLFINLDRGYRRDEAVDLRIGYHGTPGKRGLLIGKNRLDQRVFFAENWPDSAHYWFPCIDHPHDKATVEFAITAPEKYSIIANGILVGDEPLEGGRRLTRWREGVPIPTYCMAFGAAEFRIIQAGPAAKAPIAFYAYPSDARAARTKFARSALVMDYFAGLIGPYPYEKLAQVEATTRFGGMENASAIFYAESSFAEDSITEAPVAHEIAHQWFGNSITAADWDHLWLSEGFATYFETLFYEHMDGPDALKRRMEHSAKLIMKQHEKKPGPVIDPALSNPAQKLNPYSYEKGAWILHMLRGLMGDQAFFEGIRRYYGLFAGKTALSEDFAKEMESISGMPLSGFFRQWLYRSGWPRYRASWLWDPEARSLLLTIRQEQAGGLYDMPLEIVVRAGSSSHSLKVRISDREKVVRIPLPEKPDTVEIDPNGWVLKSLGSTTKAPRHQTIKG